MARKRRVKLINAPVGLFMYGDSCLALKTEYSSIDNGVCTPDCYIVESGEYFWGGASSTEERNNLLVTPVDCDDLICRKENK